MGNITLKPEQKRRLAAEQAIYAKGFNSFAECAEACEKLAQKINPDATFSRLSIQKYVGCQTNLSVRRLEILAEVLGITNYRELNEIFTAPKHRACGEWWTGDNGNRVKDIDMTMMDRF